MNIDFNISLNITAIQLQLKLVMMLESILTAVKVTGWIILLELPLAMFLEESAIVILYANVLVIVVMMSQKISHIVHPVSQLHCCYNVLLSGHSTNV